MSLKSLLAAVAAAATLSACAGVDPATYRDEKPAFVLEEYFNGRVDGWGMVQDYSGKVIKRFTVRIDARWEGNTGTLDEDFTFSDGTRQQRVWTVVKDGADRYSGTAADVIGTATGVLAGNAIRWNYVLALPVGDSVYHVNMDDWMFLVDDRTLLNRTAMKKFGFKVGEVTLSFTKR